MDPMEGDAKLRGKRWGRNKGRGRQDPFTFLHSFRNSFTSYGPNLERIEISQANVLSLALYTWLTPLMLQLCRRGAGSLLNLTWCDEDKTEQNVKILEKAWKEELRIQGPEKARLGRAICSAFRKRLVCSCIVIIITLSFSFLGSACILRLLLDYVSDSERKLWVGITIVCALILCEVCRSLTFSLAWCLNYWTGMRVREASMGLLFKKIQCLRSLKDKTIGELVNMCSNDGQRLYEVMANGPFIIGGPFVFVAGSIYLGFLLDFWALIGIGTYIVVFILMKFVLNAVEHFRMMAVTLTGQRVGLMTEVLTCMKLIKMNAWEESFIRRISKKRNEEKSALENASFLQSVLTSMVPMVPVIASVVMFISFILTGNDLTPSKAFTVIAVLYSISFSLALMLHGVRTLADANVACIRYKAQIIIFKGVTNDMAIQIIYQNSAYLNWKKNLQKIKDVLLMDELTPFSDDVEGDNVVEMSRATLSFECEEEEPLEATDEDSIIAGLNVQEFNPLTSSFRSRKSGMENRGILPKTTKTEDLDSNLNGSHTGLLHESSQDSQGMPQLCGIDLNIRKGELIGICGMKGSGKSSFLAAIMGRMQLLSGNIKVTGRIAFVGQEPWIFNGTAKDNILFGQPMDEEKYKKTVFACQLDKDFETFGAGDKVQIGDRGLTLSGGQKQRISLARAIYSDSDIYLLDDPLSALDIHIGRHVFTQGLKIMLRDKTVLFVTHHLEYLPKCDRLMLIHEGRVEECGTHTQLLGSPSGPMYTELYQLYQSKYEKVQRHRQTSIKETQFDDAKTPQRGFSRLTRRTLSRQLSRMPTTHGIQHQFSTMSTTSSIYGDYDYVDIEDLVDIPELQKTNVSWSVYGEYIRAMGGYGVLVFLLISFALSIAVQSGATWFLAYWLMQGNGSVTHDTSAVPDMVTPVSNFTSTLLNTSSWMTGSTSLIQDITSAALDIKSALTGNGMTSVDVTSTMPAIVPASMNISIITGSVADHPQVHIFAMVYGLFLAAMLLMMLFRSIIFVKIMLQAASSLHRKLLKKTMSCPMKFFDSTPFGIILNRFSADIDEIDVRLPSNCELYLQNIFLVIFALILICYVLPYDLLVVAPIAAVFVFLAIMFAPVVQQLKFMDSMTRAPYLSHLASSVEGMATIQVFGQSERFFKRFCEMLDQNNIPFFLFYMANRWLAVFLDLMTIVIMGVTGFLIIFTSTRGTTSHEGLALTFAIQITSLLQYTLRLTIETGSRFSSVQRVQEYIEKLQTEGTIASLQQEPADWPSEGAITFNKYRMRYSDLQPLALKEVTLTVMPKEKIGIVGSSGSGKSSLGVAMFRLSEAAAGAIYIDNYNVRDIKLRALRSRISILVQDPVLFVGTIRYNLDPAQRNISDHVLWDALTKCHMKEKINSLDGQLDYMVEENGKNFSLGERQLLCLARTMLRNSKILVLDEATASVDTRTELLVQQTIREYCRDCTVLTIAHRINTIWDSDKVLVMDHGKAVEFSPPGMLLQKSHSKFKAMYDAMKSSPRGESINEEEEPAKRDSMGCDDAIS